ncbi:aldehyde dehydrogenase family protein [Labrys neptuniae]
MLTQENRDSPAEVGRINVVNPATENLIETLAAATDDEVRHLVDASKRASLAWEQIPLAERAKILLASLQAIEAQAGELADLLTAENGKPIAAAKAEVASALRTARELVQLSAGMAGALPQLGGTEIGFQLLAPRGVVACITPWNFPLAIGLEAVFAALAMGNGVVWKPSEKAPLACAAAHRLASGSLPKGLFQFLVGGPVAGQTLVEHAQIDAIVFIGSEKTGRAIAASAGRNLKKCVLELGGSDALIVDAGVDPKAAARFAADACFANAGQICTSTERIYVHRSLHEAFIDALCREAESLVVGPGADPSTQMGPLIDGMQLGHVERQVADAVTVGARIVTGGSRLARKGFFFAPTVLADVPPRSRLVTEETFGPVAPVYAVESFERGLELANASRFGLGAIVLTADAAHAHLAANRLAAGMIKINARRGKVHGATSEPFGVSGLGAGYGTSLLRELAKEKSVQWGVLA